MQSSLQVGAKFSHSDRRAACHIVTGLCPYKLSWIELRSVARKVKGMDSRMFVKKRLNFLAMMNGMIIPHQDDGAINTREQMFKKDDDLLPSHSTFMRLDAQLDSSPFGRYDQGAERAALSCGLVEQ